MYVGALELIPAFDVRLRPHIRRRRQISRRAPAPVINGRASDVRRSLYTLSYFETHYHNHRHGTKRQQMCQKEEDRPSTRIVRNSVYDWTDSIYPAESYPKLMNCAISRGRAFLCFARMTDCH